MLACLEMIEGSDLTPQPPTLLGKGGMATLPAGDNISHLSPDPCRFAQPPARPEAARGIWPRLLISRWRSNRTSCTWSSHRGASRGHGEDVIAACQVARRAIEDAVHGAPDMTADPRRAGTEAGAHR